MFTLRGLILLRLRHPAVTTQQRGCRQQHEVCDVEGLLGLVHTRCAVEKRAITLQMEKRIGGVRR
jgi:hypothetical protein